MTGRVTIVTSGHPSTCPRMVKAADAAVEAGFSVRMVSVDYIDWAAQLDADLVQRRHWSWRAIRLRRPEHPWASRWVSARQRAARALADCVGPQRVPMGVAVRAYARTHTEIVAAILAEPFDFVYGGTVATLAATAEAAGRAGRPFALDFEDFHPAESEETDAELTNALACRVVRDVVARASFTTTASLPMAEAYARQFAATPIVVHNVVPRPTVVPRTSSGDGPLKLYWFSQVVGPRRGLEDVVRAIAIAGIRAELHLRGASRREYVEELKNLSQREHADVTVTVHEPGASDDMVRLCEPFDIGLSLEQEGVLNRALCLPNKPFTYLAAGLAVIATDTPGQRTLQSLAAEGIWWYRPGDVHRLAEGLRRWHCDRTALGRARARSYGAATQRFHWEHPLERGALLGAIEQALS